MFSEQKEKTYVGGEHKDSAMIYLQVENPEEDEAEIDIVNVAINMSRRKRLYRYLLALAACFGVFAGLLMVGIGQLMGNSSYAQAVMTFQYEGIEDGLDPNGAALDVNKVKAPAVIEEALASLGITDISAEDIRQNIVIEGVIPEDAVERITVIKEMSLEDASNYEKILEVSYFPSQYVVSLYQDKGMSSSETREILNAVLESYRTYFLDTYANTAVLTVTSNLIQYQDYDYTEAVDMVQSQIDIMERYVTEHRSQAPDFRSANTGLSFGDIEMALQTIADIDLANLTSYIESNHVTKDKLRLAEYYNYKIKKYNMELSELQVQLTTVQNTIDSYTKDPVIIVSSQESTQEITQTNEYYDKLVQQKLDLSGQIAAVNTDLNETYELLNAMNTLSGQNTQQEYDYAEEKLANITATISEWAVLIEETTEEYYNTTLFSNAVKIVVPAQYQAAGGIVEIAKKILVCVALMVFVVVVVWCMDGLRMELAVMRNRKKGKQTE